MDYTIIVEKDQATGFYSGQCQQLPEAITQGKTMDELLDNMREAIALVLEEQKQMVISNYAGHKFFRRKLTVAWKKKNSCDTSKKTPANSLADKKEATP